jgi:hypothetical protein
MPMQMDMHARAQLDSDTRLDGYSLPSEGEYESLRAHLFYCDQCNQYIKKRQLLDELLVRASQKLWPKPALNMDQIEQIKKNSHPRWEKAKPWSLTHRHVHETILFGFILLTAIIASVFLSIQDSDDGIPRLSLKEFATPTAVTVSEVPVRKLIDIEKGIYESYESVNQNGMQRRYSIDDESEQDYTLLGAFESISASCLSISPLVNLLATCSHIGRVSLWSIEQKRVFVSVKGQGIPITDLSFSPDGSLVAASSQDGKVTLLHTTDGSVLTELPRYSEEVFSVAFSPNGKYLSAGASGAGWIWELKGGKYNLVDYFPYPNEKVNDVAYSSDGNLIAFAVSDGNIWIRRASNGKLISRLAEQRRITQNILRLRTRTSPVDPTKAMWSFGTLNNLP